MEKYQSFFVLYSVSRFKIYLAKKSNGQLPQQRLVDGQLSRQFLCNP
ncbi:MAG: hypothetical protein MZV70_74360 [Desulfobacterales bacterium]|nr:hypothetical protein [Desulfobacterales bacterium]